MRLLLAFLLMLLDGSRAISQGLIIGQPVKALSSAAPSPATSLKDNLIAYWTMDEASGARTDSWTNTIVLDDINTVTSTTGQINDAALFTAANQESLENLTSDPENQLLQFYTGGSLWVTRTITFWVYFNTTTDQNLISCGNGASNSQYGSQLISQRFTFYLRSSGSGITKTVTASSPAIVTSRWYWLRMWLDSAGDTINIQVWDSDSASYSSVFSTALAGLAAHNSPTPFYLGRFWNSEDFNLNGRMDEFGLWGRLLTDTERDYLVTPARPNLTP